MRCLTEFVIKTCGCRPIENKGKKCLQGGERLGEERGALCVDSFVPDLFLSEDMTLEVANAI